MNLHQAKQLFGNNLWYGENGRHATPLQLALVGLVMPDGSKVWGIDISHWNAPKVDLKRMKEVYGLSFVIIKGCDGTLESRYFKDHRQNAIENGLAWGIYDWLYPDNKVSVNAQTTAWANQAAQIPPPMGVFIDAEATKYGGQPANPTAADLRKAHDGYRNKSGQRATTYTSPGYANAYLDGFDWSREELWIAHYGVISPSLPDGAHTWTFHQFASTLDGAQLDPNGNRELDGNYYNGTHAQFYNRYGAVTNPPPNGGNMGTVGTHKGVVHANTNIKRMSDGVVMVIATANDVVYGKWNSAHTDFIDFDHYYKANGTRVELGVMCKCVTQNMTVTVETEPTTPPPGNSDITGVRFTGELTFDNADGTSETWHVSDVPFIKGPA